MRDLTKKQKRLLEEFLDENPEVNSVDDLIQTDYELYGELERINDTEILYQNVNRFIEDRRNVDL